MNAEPLTLPGCFRLLPKVAEDDRGTLVKDFVADEYAALKLPTAFAEEFYSRSNKNVLRGMHYQSPPHDLAKVVSCIHGRVRDVLVDLRVGSPLYRAHEIIDLSAGRASVLFLPPGIAHGYLVLSEMAIIAYRVTRGYAPSHDAGVRWDTIGANWGIRRPIVSARDASFPALAQLDSPFVYQPHEVLP